MMKIEHEYKVEIPDGASASGEIRIFTSIRSLASKNKQINKK